MIKHVLTLCLILSVTVMGCSQQPKKGSAKKNKEIVSVSEYYTGGELEKYSSAIFAGGCFWCTEAQFHRIAGVIDVISGYSGGEQPYPTYYDVGGGNTGHAEAIYVLYDDSVIDYQTLLEIFFVGHDPTQLNRQGPDVGPEYRSAIFYQTSKEKQLIDKYVQVLNSSGKYKSKIVTEISPYKEFWVAEAYHQDYYELHPENRYVQNISRKKVEKVVATFPELLKPEYQ